MAKDILNGNVDDAQPNENPRITVQANNQPCWLSNNGQTKRQKPRKSTIKIITMIR